jgi:glycine dehydrogenase
MLAYLGYASFDELIDAAIPASLRDHGLPLSLPHPVSEAEVQAKLAQLAARNKPLRSLIGFGYYGAVTPPVIRRLVLEDPAWYTAYTPYQPEISQGRLEVLMHFQTIIAELTGLPVAGASLLDEGTAVAEAISMARRAVKTGSEVVIGASVLTQTVDVVQTRMNLVGLKHKRISLVDEPEAISQADPFAVVIQVPTADGRLPNRAELEAVAAATHAKGALLIVAADPLALTLIDPPAAWGADVVVGSTQRFGCPLFFGGPHAAYIAIQESLTRQLPGRLVGLSVDSAGNPALRLALQTREQHIRREKATSNICTSAVLMACVAALYVVYHGPDGLRQIAQTVHDKANRLAQALQAVGRELVHGDFFDTVQLAVPDANQAVNAARQAGFHICLVDDAHISMSVGEDLTDAELDALIAALGGDVSVRPPTHPLQTRASDYLLQPVFNQYHSETEFMRYVTRLAKRDFALDTGMIPLGSCTMKLNSATVMEPISYPGFANLHPFAPFEDALGYVDLISELSDWLADITGYDEVSIAPNAGSQGEFAGLKTIRAYYRAKGEDRDVCLLPASAHGTNAASAAMAGLKVVQVKTAADGSVDLGDLDAKLAQYPDQVAVVMITYPSTHGVFEETVKQIIAKAHAAGAQVYIDGANLNALLGLASPGRLGADVSHLNLHKTFAMPHGGGGPGVGPVAVKEHLAPYLHDAPVTAAPFGSPGLLPISYAFIALLGARGLQDAAKVAILNANYVSKRLADTFPTLYTGQNGLVAHECILDLHELTKQTHVTVDDVAKRLIDYGFHAPTMSFPVAGTLMVEPTESESKSELDRFCDAMIAIHAEALAAADPDNCLANAPHTLAEVTADDWTHPYSRAVAMAGQPEKYWSPVGRIDNVTGDRHFIGTW